MYRDSSSPSSPSKYTGSPGFRRYSSSNGEHFVEALTEVRYAKWSGGGTDYKPHPVVEGWSVGGTDYKPHPVVEGWSVGGTDYKPHPVVEGWSGGGTDYKPHPVVEG